MHFLRTVVAAQRYWPRATQNLRVVIDGKKYELRADALGHVALLNLADYKAKLIEDVHKTTYQTTQSYQFQFPDKKTMKFSVIGQSE